MTPAETLQRLVALEFKVPCSAIACSRDQRRDISLARHVWFYLMTLYLPLPDSYPVRGGGRRPRRDHDTGQTAAARAAGFCRQSVRYGIRRVEDMRDDPAFDARIERLEAQAASA